MESALRFGTPFLVEDAKIFYDPILYIVLKEQRKTGGLVLITLGDQDIDLSTTFTIFLSTSDPTVEVPPDICSSLRCNPLLILLSLIFRENQVYRAEPVLEPGAEGRKT